MSVKLHSYRELADTLRMMVRYKISIPNFRYNSEMMFTNSFKHPNCSCLFYTYPQSIHQFAVPASATATSVKANSVVESTEDWANPVNVTRSYALQISAAQQGHNIMINTA